MQRSPSWLTVLICGSLIVTLSVGVRQVSGVFLAPVVADLGLGREAFGFAVAVQNLVWGVTQPVAGFLADRYGARPIAIAGGVVYAAGVVIASSAPSGAAFLAGWGVLAGVGQAGTAYAVILAVIGRASPADRRSQVLGLASAAGSIGMFVLVPLTSALIERLGWRGSLLCMAAALAFVPVLALALREERRANAQGTTPLRFVLGSALHDRDFWFLNLGFAACGFQLAFLATYLPTIVIDAGLSLATGAGVLAAIGTSNIIGTLLAGWAGGRWRKSRVLVVLYLARATLILTFLAIPLSSASAIVFGFSIGLLWTGTVPLTSGIVADLWGRQNLGLLFGLTYVGHQVGAFGGAWAGGFAFERTGSFALVWAVAVALSLAAAILHLMLIERPRGLALRAAEATA